MKKEKKYLSFRVRALSPLFHISPSTSSYLLFSFSLVGDLLPHSIAVRIAGSSVSTVCASVSSAIGIATILDSLQNELSSFLDSLRTADDFDRLNLVTGHGDLAAGCLSDAIDFAATLANNVSVSGRIRKGEVAHGVVLQGLLDRGRQSCLSLCDAFG